MLPRFEVTVDQFRSFVEATGYKTDAEKGKTTPVGKYPSNAWGLYDMHGNVIEWCSDFYGKYKSAKQVNPTGPKESSTKIETHILRGGNYFNNEGQCRAARRNYSFTSYRSSVCGFRIAKDK